MIVIHSYSTNHSSRILTVGILVMRKVSAAALTLPYHYETGTFGRVLERLVGNYQSSGSFVTLCQNFWSGSALSKGEHSQRGAHCSGAPRSSGAMQETVS
jgi:hypothetical protein